jgi:ATP-dependent Clp protease ATP-binding subunit ClpA
LDELSKKPNSILFIDEAHQMDAGEGKGQMGLGLSSMLKPLLSRGVIKVIASTTWEGYRQTFEKDTALMRRFRVIQVDEPSHIETIEILKGSREVVEKHHNVTIEDSAIDAAVEFTVKYQTDKKLPDKAIDILDSACARKHILEEERIINRASIIREIEDIARIKIKAENENENAASVLTFADRLKKIVHHQESAIDKVAQSVITAQAGLRNPNKPIGRFLFVGPSGVGKTMTARKIADDLGMDFIKYDMSEFQERHAASRLIGAPPGYVGFGDSSTGEGQLVNDIIRHPNCVFLLDEVEKAHPDIFNVFLQVFDDGQVTGTTGKVADARNCIFIMSSNLGTREGSKENLGFNKDKSGKSASIKAVEGFFLTEFRGRWTATIEFQSLDEVSYRLIVVERINDISTLLPKRNLQIIASETLISHILELNNSVEFGAREIDKHVSDTIYYPLSVKILQGMIPNDSIVHLDWKNNELVIEPSLNKVLVEQLITK